MDWYTQLDKQIADLCNQSDGINRNQRLGTKFNTEINN